jgi:predicted transcriptional regulator
MDEEGENVFDVQIPEYTNEDLESLKIKLLNPDISDEEILDLTDKYSVLNKNIRNLFVECVGRDRLRKLQESNKSEK